MKLFFFLMLIGMTAVSFVSCQTVTTVDPTPVTTNTTIIPANNGTNATNTVNTTASIVSPPTPDYTKNPPACGARGCGVGEACFNNACYKVSGQSTERLPINVMQVATMFIGVTMMLVL